MFLHLYPNEFETGENRDNLVLPDIVEVQRGQKLQFNQQRCSAEVVKLVDTHVSGACGASCAGSSPAFGTND